MRNRFEPRDCLDAMAAIEGDLNRLINGLSEAQFHAPSDTGGWSIGFCLEHLILAGHAFLPKWDRALSHLPLRQKGAGCPEDPYSLWHRAILHRMEPPYWLKAKAVQHLTPSARRSIDDTVRRFLKMHQEVVGRIESASAARLSLSKAQSPFTPWVWYPLGFSFDLALAHERRHVWQAWKARHEHSART